MGQNVVAAHGKHLTKEIASAGIGKRPLECWQIIADKLGLDVPAQALVDASEPELQRRCAALRPVVVVVRSTHATHVSSAARTEQRASQGSGRSGLGVALQVAECEGAAGRAASDRALQEAWGAAGHRHQHFASQLRDQAQRTPQRCERLPSAPSPVAGCASPCRLVLGLDTHALERRTVPPDTSAVLHKRTADRRVVGGGVWRRGGQRQAGA